jgi:hypothetical protein
MLPPQDPLDYNASIEVVRRDLVHAGAVTLDEHDAGREIPFDNQLTHLISILHGVAERADHEAALERVHLARLQLERAQRQRRIFYATSAAASLVSIELTLTDLNPPAVIPDLHTQIARMSRERSDSTNALATLMFARNGFGAPDVVVSQLIRGMRTDMRRVYEDVRLRLGQERSLLAVFERYRQRCQWYEADRLRVLAEASSRPEDALAETLVTYLFDNGLNPLVQPMIGRIRPDALDVSSRFTFYVEAKQYKQGAPRYLLQGMQQVWDMLGQLQSTGSDVREAFYVIYRRGGPRYEFPRRLQHGERIVHVLLIDIAPIEERGSSAPVTRTFSENDLNPENALAAALAALPLDPT